MKMFALRGEKKEMELPGDFFVDSMCVALPQGWSGRGDAATAQPGAVACPGVGGELPLLELGTRGSTGSSRLLHHPGQQDQALLPALGQRDCPGGCGAPAQPSCASSSWSSFSTKQLHQRNFGRISLDLTLKRSSCASKPEIKPKCAA